MKIIKFTLISLLIGMWAMPACACRFWVGLGDGIQNVAVDHLIVQPNSLKALGDEYRDGWSVGYYGHDQEISVSRGDQPANEDQAFDNAVYQLAEIPVKIAFSHLRRASSGCVDGVPNPHPFIIEKDGISWIFGHNGGMKKQILIDLIGEGYLESSPPIVCTGNPPETWIDSELYFIYLMKSIEDHAWDVESGLEHGLKRMFRVIDEKDQYLNFFLSNGEAAWAFRKGTSLYYLENQDNRQAMVASTVPDFEQGEWKEFPENHLGKLMPNQMIKFTKVSRDVSAP